ncbi:MAG: DUF2231 domain-containing protein [Ectothiorhodospiraceae bacterium]|nr:DUF2231 domain-containing protein [Ectothiorhodospiraceae bacterium]
MSHPLHPLIVHFPVACWSLGSLAGIADLFQVETVAGFSAPLIFTGLILAVPAMLTGLLELGKTRGDKVAQDTVMTHISFVLMAWLLYAASYYMRGQDMDNALLLTHVFSITGFVTLCFAGWYGGKLVYTHGVGVQR